jgi:sucrose-6-phosphate hydrolase SacC (GH32 family)
VKKREDNLPPPLPCGARGTGTCATRPGLGTVVVIGRSHPRICVVVFDKVDDVGSLVYRSKDFLR